MLCWKQWLSTDKRLPRSFLATVNCSSVEGRRQNTHSVQDMV